MLVLGVVLVQVTPEGITESFGVMSNGDRLGPDDVHRESILHADQCGWSRGALLRWGAILETLTFERVTPDGAVVHVRYAVVNCHALAAPLSVAEGYAWRRITRARG